MAMETAEIEDKGSAVDQVVDAIRRLMRERNLGLGDALPSEIELAAMFNSSRNTVREAIRILKAYGIVESRQKVGAVITDRRQQALMELFSFAIDMSAESFLDIQGFRRLIEVNLSDLLFQTIDEAAIARLEAINDAMRLAPELSEAAEFDFKFHAELISFADNRTLSQVYGILQPLLQRLMEAGKRSRAAVESAHDEHCDIIAALKERDRIAYAYHMNRHLHAGLQFIQPPKEPRQI
ncbi:FadR/GntR family transcriptional regulator [Rhizobium paranaense]|uniref:DNA-binding FadR family transcriptional regulator n=1 Tax=Rhizobium paranaense TaxID=1650438 RepID=A0A7W8XRP1_9HYPH|nr:FCD domain-containing protein [Rhizobium paranaense]MBB5574332.1 DNA-binding FadR family transcriptional regulator [Rhizobium paranaense]